MFLRGRGATYSTFDRGRCKEVVLNSGAWDLTKMFCSPRWCALFINLERRADRKGSEAFCVDFRHPP